MSLIRQNRLKVLAKQSKSEGSMGFDTAQNSLLVELKADLEALKAIEHPNKKAGYKSENYPKYAAWVEGVINADTGAVDRIVQEMALWSVDAKRIDDAIVIANYMIKHNLALQGINRSPQTFITSEAGNVDNGYVREDLAKIAEFIKGKDVAKGALKDFYRTYATLIHADADQSKTLEDYQQAKEIYQLALENGATVKGKLEEVEKELATATAGAS